MMSEEARGNLTLGLWFLSALVLVALFISAAAQGELTSAHIVLASVILVLAVTGTTVLFRWAVNETPQAKAKRQRIDSLLRDMSADELLHLKQRLTDGDLSEETTTDFLGDDGELVQRT